MYLKFLLFCIILALNRVVPQAIEDDDSLINVSDQELEDEVRRRFIGGPWDPDNANSLLIAASNQMSTTNYTGRMRRYHSEARALLSLLTGLEDPYIDSEQDAQEDFDFVD